jgi:hypothetical protein
MGAAVWILASAPVATKAEPFLWLTQWDGAIELGGQWGSNESETELGELMLRRMRWEERLRLGVQGVLVDPRLMTFTLSGGFGLSQEDLTQAGQDYDADGTLREYDVSANWLDQKPLRFVTFANRTQQVLSREFAPRTEVLTETRGAGMQLDKGPLPSNLSYRRLEQFQESSFAGSTAQWDKIVEDVTYRGRQRKDWMDLELQYRFENTEDLIRPSFDHRLNEGSLFNRILLGPARGLSFTTTARTSDQKGPADLTFAQRYASEQAALRITDRLSANLGFIFDRREVEDPTQSLDETTTVYTGFAAMNHQLYESLTSRLSGDWTTTDFPVGNEDRFQTRLSLNYRKRIPAEGRLLIGLNGRYERVDREAISQTTVEEHEVTQPPPFSFELYLPVATIEDLTIQNPEKGITLIEGLDYLVTLAVDKAVVEIITTDPTRVEVGDRLLVQYRFVSQSPIRFDTKGVGSSIGVDFSWIGASYQHERSNQDLLSGQDASVLDDTTWDTFTLQFRFRPGRTTLLLLNEYRVYDSTRLAYEEQRFSQGLTYPFSVRLSTSLQAAESLTDYDTPVRETGQWDIRWHLNGFPYTGLEVTPFAGLRRYHDTTAPNESVRTVGLRGRESWGKLTVTGFAQYERRERDGTEIGDYQVDVRVIRRF